jgi:predicted nucleic acid-binding Zn finger protein
MNTVFPILEHQLQHERMARAQSALQRGEMQVVTLSETPLGSAAWMVASKRNRYTVSLDGDAWACTCPDFAGRCQRFGLRCKHIEAVRFTERDRIAESGLDRHYTQPQFSTKHTEEHMNQPMPTTHPPTIEASGEQILWRLRQPLDMNRVKRRQAPGQGTVPYLEGYDVIEAANDLFQFRWSFDLLSEPHIMRWDKLITFYDQRLKKKAPVLGEDGKPVTEIAGVVYITGRITVELDGKAYAHADAGRCIFNGDTPEALDMAVAGAVTDCLKRCFRQLGEQFGNSLYDKEIARTAGLENGASNGHGSNGHGSNGNGQSDKPAAPAALAQPPAPANPPASPNETQQYRDGAAVDPSNAAELEAFNSFKSIHQGLAPASREVLRAWAASQNGKK